MLEYFMGEYGENQKNEYFTLPQFITIVRLIEAGVSKIKDNSVFIVLEEDGSKSYYKINDSGHIETWKKKQPIELMEKPPIEEKLLKKTLIFTEEKSFTNEDFQTFITETEKIVYREVKKNKLHSAKPGDYLLESNPISKHLRSNSYPITRPDMVKKLTIKMAKKRVIDRSQIFVDEKEKELKIIASTESSEKYHMIYYHEDKYIEYQKKEYFTIPQLITSIRLTETGFKPYKWKHNSVFIVREEDGSESYYKINDSGHIETWSEEKI